MKKKEHDRKYRLTAKERKFAEEFVKTGNGVKAAMKAYPDATYGTANVMASKNLNKERVQKAIKSIATQIPDSLLVKKHLALLNKEEVVTKNNVTTGEVDVIPTGEIDTQAVSKGLDMAYKLKGIYAPEKKDITSQGERILIPNPEVLRISGKYEEEIKQEL